MKIRIFALAKELGLDSKELIEYCNRAGVMLKPSALASISPEERDRVLSYINENAAVATEAAEAPGAPVREAPIDVTGKVRQIKTIPPPPRPQNGRGRSAPVAEPSPADAETTDTEAPAETEAPREAPTAEPAETGEPAAAAPPVPPETAREAPAELPAEAAETAAQIGEPVESPAEPSVAAPAAEAGAPVTEPPAETAAPAAEEESATPVEAEAVPAAAAQAGQDEADEEQEPPAPRRADYLPPSGVTRSSVREMKPQGTVPESELRHGRRAKEKSKPSLPTIAAPPTYKAPKLKKPKASEGPAQKPEVPLTPDALDRQSPLRDHLRKSTEDKEKKKLGDRPPIDIARRRTAAEQEEERQRQQRMRKRPKRGVQEDGGDRLRLPRRRRQKGGAPVHLKTEAQIAPPITVRSLSEAIGRPAKTLMQMLWSRNQMVTINGSIDEETALDLSLELGVDLEIRHDRDIEAELQAALTAEAPPEQLVARAPIVTILGHVDHGKTTLLDKLRSANVAAGEAGGITQHIASYQVERHGQRITFVDTPGHAAFGEMRARGANVTDIVVLVVAADDGVMPQTVECISHARAAGVPMIVAMNKIDLPDVNEPKVLQGLAAQDVLPAEWGGDTEVVRTSAETGQGLDDLLETILLTAELRELKANPARPALGVCLEAFRDEGRGVLAWVIVQQGTLRVGDILLCGQAYGRVRAIYNDRDEEIAEAGPSTPVRVAGLDVIPGAGDRFFVLTDLEEARQTAENRRDTGRTTVLSTRGRPRTLEDILNAARGGEVQDLPLILKADTPGSLEALKGELQKFQHPEVRVQVVHEGVGGVNESDVSLASASGAIVIAFYVVPEDRALALAEREGVEIRRYSIIYEVTADIKRTLEGLLRPEKVEVATGRALVLQTFSISRYGTVAGCRVLSGTIERNHRVRVIRDQKVLHEYGIASLKRGKEDAREVREGMECGIRLDGFNDVKEGDLFEAFKIEEVKRTLD